MPLFEKDGDFAAFQRVMALAQARCPIRILGYCLLPNHWRFAVIASQLVPEISLILRTEVVPAKLAFPSNVILSEYDAGMEHELLTVQNVKDLQDGGKRWLENVLGQHLKESQQVFIMVFTPGVEPDEAWRRQALASVKQTMTQVEKNLAEQGVTDEEFNAAADAAMEDVRRREP